LWELCPFELRNIPENCSAYVPMILKEYCSSKINGLVMKNFFREIVTL
jgi:hypothetical protein